MAAPRSTAQRKSDVLEKLRTQKDVWVASATAKGDAHLVPLSFYWDGARLTVATPDNSLTARNLRRAGVARMALGPTRDVIILEGSLEFIQMGTDNELADDFAKGAGFDARGQHPKFVYIRMTPTRIQAWREVNEIAEREIMTAGKWLE